MNTLKNEIKSVNDRVSRMKPLLFVLHRTVTDMNKDQDHMDHRVSVCEETSNGLEQRLAVLEKYVFDMADHLNGTIERINALHLYLKEQEQSLECDEQMSSSDEEFDLDDMNKNFKTMAKNI